MLSVPALPPTISQVWSTFLMPSEWPLLIALPFVINSTDSITSTWRPSMTGDSGSSSVRPELFQYWFVSRYLNQRYGNQGNKPVTIWWSFSRHTTRTHVPVVVLVVSRQTSLDYFPFLVRSKMAQIMQLCLWMHVYDCQGALCRTACWNSNLCFFVVKFTPSYQQYWATSDGQLKTSFHISQNMHITMQWYIVGSFFNCFRSRFGCCRNCIVIVRPSMVML